ncbi:hypothetical protein ACYVU7_12045 [Arenicellales bacterium IMCC56312]
MPRRRYSKQYSRSRSSYASQRREQHVREAAEFSQEIGGTDQDVKAYFFSLSGSELSELLSEYGQLYGDKAEQYARTAFTRWKQGSTRMSGQTAKRLFDLLPPRMPVSKKYTLIETLWRKLGPRSYKVLEVGANANPDAVFNAVHQYISTTVEEFVLPADLKNRFKWLAANDVRAQQQLLNHFQELEKKQVVDLFKVELPILLKHRSGSPTVQGMRKILEVNNHKFEIQIIADGQEVRLKDQKVRSTVETKTETSYAWIFWLIAGVLGVFLLNS